MYDRMVREHGYCIRKLAEKLGKDKGYLENRLRLADAPPEIRELVSLRKDTLSHAYELMKVEDPKKRKRLAEQVARDELSLVKLREKIEGRRPASRRTPTRSRPTSRTTRPRRRPPADEEGWVAAAAGRPIGTTASSPRRPSCTTPSRSCSTSSATPRSSRPSAPWTGRNLAKYLTIAKLRLENAIAVVRTGRQRPLTQGPPQRPLPSRHARSRRHWRRLRRSLRAGLRRLGVSPWACRGPRRLALGVLFGLALAWSDLPLVFAVEAASGVDPAALGRHVASTTIVEARTSLPSLRPTHETNAPWFGKPSGVWQLGGLRDDARRGCRCRPSASDRLGGLGPLGVRRLSASSSPSSSPTSWSSVVSVVSVVARRSSVVSNAVSDAGANRGRRRTRRRRRWRGRRGRRAGPGSGGRDRSCGQCPRMCGMCHYKVTRRPGDR